MSRAYSSYDPLSDPVIAAFLQYLQRAIGENLREVWLFGSRARGESTTDSDYDVCIVVDADSRETERVVSATSYEILDEYEDLIGGPVYDQEEWRQSMDTPLGWNIRREGVRLL